MTRTVSILASLFLLLLSASGQETKLTMQRHGSTKVEEIENWTMIGCTNGGHLQLAGEVRVAEAVPTCTDSSCKEISQGKLAAGANVPIGSRLSLYCSTKADDEQFASDTTFCKNNASNPQPASPAEWEKHEAEFSQCLKDRSEYRREKEKQR